MVQFKNGSAYFYSGVSRRAILNLQMNPCLSLGSWFNYNCLGGNAMREVASSRKLWQSFA